MRCLRAVVLMLLSVESAWGCAERNVKLAGHVATVDARKQGVVLLEQRLLGEAIETFALDRGVYPSSDGQFVDLSEIAPNLVPEYLPRLPRVDPWGAPYRYWSDGKRYVVISFGTDSEPDVEPPVSITPGDSDEEIRSALCRGETQDAAADIVWLDGNHCQWPRASSSE